MIFKYFNKQSIKPKYLDNNEISRPDARYCSKLRMPNIRNVKVFLFKTLHCETGVNEGK